MTNQNQIRFKSDYTFEEPWPHEEQNYSGKERLMSIEEIAGLRMKDLCTRGTDVYEVVLYTSEGPFITKNSPPLITNGLIHPMWESRSKLEDAFKNAIKVKSCRIPSDRLSEDEVMSFLFGAHAKGYGELLTKRNVPSIVLSLNNDFLNIREDPQFHKVYLAPLRFKEINYGSASVLDGTNVLHPKGSYRLRV